MYPIHSSGDLDATIPYCEPELNLATIRSKEIADCYAYYFAFETLASDIGLLPDTLITFAVADWIDLKADYPQLIPSVLISLESTHV